MTERQTVVAAAAAVAETSRDFKAPSVEVVSLGSRPKGPGFTSCVIIALRSIGAFEDRDALFGTSYIDKPILK